MEKVTSKDGTVIAYDKLGSGAPIIFAAGATCFRKFPPIAATAEALAQHFTVYNYDRRGRGDSTDTQPFDVMREVEDIESLIVDAGGSVFLYGHSSGAALALEAALVLGDKVTKLALYEPPYCVDEKALEEAKAFDASLAALLAEGKRGEAIEFMLSGVGLPTDEIRQAPYWSTLEALAPTLLYDSAAASRLVPTTRAARITVPTLVIYAEESYDFMRDVALSLAKAIPHAELKALQNQGHDGDPQVVAAALAEFWNRG